MNTKILSKIYLLGSTIILITTIFFTVPEANATTCWNCYSQTEVCQTATNCGMTACNNPGCEIYGSYCDVKPNCGSTWE